MQLRPVRRLTTCLGLVVPALAVTIWVVDCLHAQLIAPLVQDVRDIEIDGASSTIPRWSGGAFIQVDEHNSPRPTIRIFDPLDAITGNRLLSVRVPAADLINVLAVARGADGTIVHGGWARDAHGRMGAYLAITTPDAASEKLIRTEPYQPISATFAPDGTIWVRGVELDEGLQRGPSHTDRGVLRHLDRFGALLGSYIPQSEVPRESLFGGIDRLCASATRVGWYPSRFARSYIEWDGTAIKSYSVVPIAPDESISGMAILDDGAVFISRDRTGSHNEIFSLDRDKQIWNLVRPHGGRAADTTNLIIGGTGTAVVFKVAWGDYRRYRMVNAALLYP